jgi:hypothetical protein
MARNAGAIAMKKPTKAPVSTDPVAEIMKRAQELAKLSTRHSEKVQLCAILERIWSIRPDLIPYLQHTPRSDPRKAG